MDKAGFFGEMLEKGQQTVQKSASDVAKSVVGQLGVKQGESSPDNQGSAQAQQGNSQNQNQPVGETVPQAASTEETKNFVKEFYASSTKLPENLTPELTQQIQQKDKLETQQKLTNLRQELHKSTYYEPLTAYENKKEEQQEESKAEKVEREKKEEEQKKMQLEEKKTQEEKDIAKTRAQTKTEANRGVAG